MTAGQVPGPVAIVTGGSRGIGRATGVVLAQAGFNVVTVGLSQGRVDEVTRELNRATVRGAVHLGLLADVSDEAQVDDMVRRTLERFGRIDLLVASAGVGRGSTDRVLPRSTQSLPLSEWQQVIDVNLTGVFLTNRAVVREMVEQEGGHIINVCSSTTRHGLRGQPYAPAYCASKFAVVGLTESLASEVSGSGVRVQALFPGAIGGEGMMADTELPQRYGRVMTVQDVAYAIGYLATSGADSVIVHPHLIPFCSRV